VPPRYLVERIVHERKAKARGNEDKTLRASGGRIECLNLRFACLAP
jgi:hypothetical protein